MIMSKNIPTTSYGILQQTKSESRLDEVAESVSNIGYGILDSGYSSLEIKKISEEFNRIRTNYIDVYGESNLIGLNEIHTIRSPLTLGGKVFINLALNSNLLSLVKKLIPGRFILNQQNGVINPPLENYNQGSWHRDLPYQHFVSTKPLAINALYCVDDFTIENGATFVLPGTHKIESFPSENYIVNNAIQVEAMAGSFIILDCMVFHAGGFNRTDYERRAVNHVFNIPFFKQQINISKNIDSVSISDEERDILGFNYLESASIADYLSNRIGKTY